ncbi:hypothetical protein GCM10023189_58480 [Nibrella saemangeumensis]|uniref:Probable molybdenum cofactor guanylyltransferase n=1 Tax=Nibrella saemangeumensis TaxID=1084526 RepID=A0ABP8NSP6_9BACT
MTSDATTKQHTKHAKLGRPALGTFARTELAILGTPCGNIKKLAYELTQRLSAEATVAYVDADHKGEDTVETIPALSAGASMVFTDKITFNRFDLSRPLNDYQWKPLFTDYDLVLVNGNHFTAQVQIAVVDPKKPLEKKLDRLTDVQLLLLKDTDTVPDYLQTHLGEKLSGIPMYHFDETDRIADWVQAYVRQQAAPLLGLVLTGGQSTRMGRDKATLAYHGKPQREYASDLLAKYCEEVYWSVNAEQAAELNGQTQPYITDSFLGLGPLGGILSAFRQRPDAAWLVLACDLPLLSEKSLDALVAGRNRSKMATAFLDSDGRFPEPLVSIWEPRAYPVLLQFLAMGHSCPRKALINSDIALLNAPDVQELTNVNDPATMQAVSAQLNE